MNGELRFYSFCNMYISHIQAGIQTGHMSDNMSVKYLLNTTLKNSVFLEKKRQHEEWIRSHKTYIVLSGGDDAEIHRINDLLNNICNGEILALPIGNFNEPGMGGMMSCCGVVVPERFFNAKKSVDTDTWDGIPEFKYTSSVITGDRTDYFVYEKDSVEYQFIELIKSKPLFK